MLVVARTGEDAAKRGRMTLFIVDTSAPGLSKRRIPVEIQLPEKQYELSFDDVWVEDDRRVGEVGQGMSFLFQGLNPERITGAAIENGIARYALARASRYARERRVWDVPIGSHQGIAHPLAEAAINVELARLATAKAAWLHDRGRPASSIEHGEVCRSGGGIARAGRRHSGAWGQRARIRVPDRASLGSGAVAEDSAG